MFNTLAEKAVISLLLNNPELLPEISGRLVPDDFCDMEDRPKNRVVYNALLSGNFDIVRLVESTSLPIQYLKKYQEFDSSIDELDNYISLIKKESLKRKFEEKLKLLNSAGKEKEADDLLVMVEKVLEELRRTYDGGVSVSRHSIKGRLDEYMSQVAREKELPLEQRLLKTPWPAVNSLLGGLYYGDYTIIGADTGQGKTSFVNQIEQTIVARGKRVINFCLEMSLRRIIERRVSFITGIPIKELADLSFFGNKEKEGKYYHALSRLRDQNLYLFGAEYRNFSRMKNAIYSTLKETEIDLIVVDYLQLMYSGAGERRDLELGGISDELKEIAASEGVNCHIIATSQLSSEHVKKTDPRPGLFDLRDAKNIANSADVVGFLYKASTYKDGVDNPDHVEFLVEKNRNDAVGKVILRWNGKAFSFENILEGFEEFTLRT